MKDLVNINGNTGEDNCGFINRAFLFGDGFFESFRLKNGQVLFRELHERRILEAASVLKLDIEPHFLERVFEAVTDLYQKHDQKQPYRGRVTIYRKGTGLYTPDENEAQFAIQLSTTEKHEFVLNRTGLLVDLFNGLPKPVNVLSSFKTLNSLPFVMAGLEKKERGLDEVIILNTFNRVCETSTSNIFCVKGDLIVTPSIQEGCVNGVMRSVILSNAGSQGLKVRESALTTLDLYECDELFITNAARGIQWIMGFRNKRYFNKVSGKLVRMLNDLVQ